MSQTAPAPAVSTIAAALAMVPEGGTIAIDAGTYSESVTLTQNVHLVGRCAATVIVDASGLRGVFASGFFSAELQSFTVNGGSGGIVAAGTNITASNMILLNNQIAVLAGYGGSVKLSSSLIDGGGQANSATSEDGAVTVSGGSQATLTDVEIRNFSPAVTAYQASSSVTLSRSLVSYMGPEASTSLVTAWTGSSVTVEESALSTLQAGLVYVGAALPGMSGDPASITFTSSELTQSGYNRQDISVAIGAGATAAFDQTTVHYQSSIGVFVSDQGSSAKLTGCALRGDPTFDVIREALEVGMGASAEIDDSAVVGAIQTALLVGDSGSSLTLQRDLVQGTTFVGPGPNSRLMGSGIAVGAGGETRLTMTDTSLVQNQQFGLYVAEGGVAEVTGLLVDGMVAAAVPGSGVLVEGGGELALHGAVLRNSAESAVACVSGGAVVSSSSFVGNKVALAVDPSVVVQSIVDPANPTPANVLLYQNVYEENGTVQGPPPTYLPGT